VLIQPTGPAFMLGAVGHHQGLVVADGEHSVVVGARARLFAEVVAAVTDAGFSIDRRDTRLLNPELLRWPPRMRAETRDEIERRGPWPFVS